MELIGMALALLMMLIIVGLCLSPFIFAMWSVKAVRDLRKRVKELEKIKLADPPSVVEEPLPKSMPEVSAKAVDIDNLEKGGALI
jgi:hypothetical protein